MSQILRIAMMPASEITNLFASIAKTIGCQALIRIASKPVTNRFIQKLTQHNEKTLPTSSLESSVHEFFATHVWEVGRGKTAIGEIK